MNIYRTLLLILVMFMCGTNSRMLAEYQFSVNKKGFITAQDNETGKNFILKKGRWKAANYHKLKNNRLKHTLKIKYQQYLQEYNQPTPFIEERETVVETSEILVTLPDTEILQKRFQEESFGHFIEKTNIVEQLAGKDKYILGIIITVELALHDYAQCVKDTPFMAAMMNMCKNKIFELILQDQPDALKKLRETLLEIENE